MVASDIKKEGPGPVIVSDILAVHFLMSKCRAAASNVTASCTEMWRKKEKLECKINVFYIFHILRFRSN